MVPCLPANILTGLTIPYMINIVVVVGNDECRLMNPAWPWKQINGQIKVEWVDGNGDILSHPGP